MSPKMKYKIPSLNLSTFIFNASLVTGFTTTVTKNWGTNCFVPPNYGPSASPLILSADVSDNYGIAVEDIGFYVDVTKPLGVVFGENPEPYFGLVVDDLEFGSNGAKAGLRVGDNLVSIDGKLVIGQDFDSVMELLRNAEGTFELQLYRGTARMLYDSMPDNTLDESSDDSEEIIMDETYEAPTIDLSQYEKKPLTAEGVLRAFTKIGKNLGELLTEDDSVVQSQTKEKTEEKKGGGIFGIFSQETIQLEGEESRGYRVEGKKTSGSPEEDIFED